jgi:hypothetical protein
MIVKGGIGLNRRSPIPLSGSMLFLGHLLVPLAICHPFVSSHIKSKEEALPSIVSFDRDLMAIL